MTLAASSLLRFLVMSVLSLVLLVYLVGSVSKFRQGGIGVAVEERPATSFTFPSVSVCGHVPRFMPVDDLSSLIVTAHHDLVGDRGNGSDM